MLFELQATHSNASGIAIQVHLLITARLLKVTFAQAQGSGLSSS